MYTSCTEVGVNGQWTHKRCIINSQITACIITFRKNPNACVLYRFSFRTAFSTGSAEHHLSFTGYVGACALLIFIMKIEKTNFDLFSRLENMQLPCAHIKSVSCYFCRQFWIRCTNTSLDFIWFKLTICTDCRAVLSGLMSSRRQSSLLLQRIKMKR